MKTYLALGSNLANPRDQVLKAIEQMKTWPQCRFLAASSLYVNPPMGPQDQPDYVNAVVALNTILSPLQLLDLAQEMEQRFGRVKKRHWGERIIDVDILLYGSEHINTERLTIPHPGMLERCFVMLPLAEIAPDLCFGEKPIRECLSAFSADQLHKLVDHEISRVMTDEQRAD